MNTPVGKLTSNERASIRLVCLPYAGGTSAAFYRWRSLLPEWIELAPLELPGRDGRSGEPLGTDLRSLAARLTDEVGPRLESPFVLLGHSLGAWLAFELARELRRRGWPPPRLLIASASQTPHTPAATDPLHALPDEQFVAAVDERYGGIPSSVRANAELLRLLLPVLRADVRMVETYQYIDEPPLDIDLLVLAGTDDRAVRASQLAGWRAQTTRGCSVRMLPGEHFFLFGDDDHGAAPSAALRAIVARLEQYVATAGTEDATT